VDRIDQLLDLGPVEARYRRVRAHAAGVRTDVAVLGALEVLYDGERECLGAIAESEDGHLFALEQLLDHDLLAERRHRSEGPVELFLGPADEDALPRRQGVGLDDARRPCN
jgi:hypothetical protein